MRQYSSIFNDVLGPVMSGPSSSHTAASVRIGNLVGQMSNGKLTKFTLDVDREGAIAPTISSQWVDRGITAGLLGMLPDDERVSKSLEIAELQGLELIFNVTTFPNNHPNTFKMKVENEKKEVISATALSVGGGMIELIEIEGYEVHMSGGFYETVVLTECASQIEGQSLVKKFKSQIDIKNEIDFKHNESEGFYEIKTEKPLDDDFILFLKKESYVKKVISLKPVLPVASQIEPSVPFSFASELLESAKAGGLEMWEMGVLYESERGGMTKDETIQKMHSLVKVMKSSLKNGLTGTTYENRILGCQSKYMSDSKVMKRLIPDAMTNEIIKCVSALMEVKSSMGVFVAAPTAGSCGGLPGTVLAVARQLNMPDEQIVKAMFAAGIIGIFLSERATFAAEVAGCQAECGSGSGMTAAALVQLMDGSAKEACDAASMALQNVFGMTCDPVGMMVEVPCLGKNILAGVNAFTSANMALSGFDAVVPLDETVDSFNEVGRLLPSELRCTGKAGLTKAPTAIKVCEKIK